jgi:hypothetical protein
MKLLTTVSVSGQGTTWFIGSKRYLSAALNHVTTSGGAWMITIAWRDCALTFGVARFQRGNPKSQDLGK